MTNYESFTKEQWDEYWYHKGYDDYLNGISLDESQASSIYGEGWLKAKFDYMASGYNIGE